MQNSLHFDGFYWQKFHDLTTILTNKKNIKFIFFYRKGFLAFVNRTDRSKETNGMTLKAMVTFQPFEIEYLKVIVHAIMNTEHRIVNSTTALNAFRQVKSRKFDINLAEKIITKFHQHKWLILDNRSGKIRFHARFLAEMEDWLRDVYPDQLLKCSKCGKTVLKSKKCPNVDCNGVFHMYCIYDKKSKVKGKCTKCGTEINMKPPSSATQTQENEPSGRSRTRSKAGAKRKRFIAEEDSETEEEDETYSEESEESNN